MSEKMKKILFGIMGVAVIVVCVFSFLTSDLEHIEDTNGPDDISLTTITDQDIIEHKMGSMGLRKSTNNLNNTIRFSSDKFTGVYEIMWTNIFFSTGATLRWWCWWMAKLLPLLSRAWIMWNLAR